MANNKQNINIGIQSNDGTGDSIRDAFRKTNDNFDVLFAAINAPTGFRFFGTLEDTPAHGIPKSILVTDSLGTTITQVQLVGGQGMSIDYNYLNNEWVLNNSASNLFSDPTPTLANNLNGNNHRAISFSNPNADQDLMTRKFAYDHFLSKDGKSQTGTSISTVTSISQLTANINLIPSTTSTTSYKKLISVYNSNGVLTGTDLTLQATSSSHIVRKDFVDTKISLQGIDTIDPATGLPNQGFGRMTGPLILSRNPITDDDKNWGGLIAATKSYVDDNSFYSSTNLFISTKGQDYQPLIPPIRRGRAPQYAFASVNKAAQFAEKLQETAKIEVGDYARLITYDNGTASTVVDIVDNFYGNNLARLRLNVGTYGSDQFGAAGVGLFTIFPGQYIQGVDSGAIALIENIIKASSQGAPEIYSIQYVDYAINFDTLITTSIPNFSNTLIVRMTFADIPEQFVPIPNFWLGYQFFTDTGVSNGTIINIDSTVDNNGIYHNYFDVEFLGSAPGAGQTFNAPQWHVYSGDFIAGEQVVYNTNVSSLQTTLVIESGEYNEQYPIRLPPNTSIRGDEFRRCIIRPAAGPSSSKWANIHFRRDAQTDGLQTSEINTTTNFAITGSLIGAGITPSAASGLITVTLTSGSFPQLYVGYIFNGNGGQGVVTAQNGGGFTVNLGTPLIDARPLASGNWFLYEPILFGYHYLRDPLRPMNLLTTVNNPGGFDSAASLITETSVKSSLQDQVISYINTTFGSFIYDQIKCHRDVGLIIDSIAHDLIFGGSGRTVYAGNTYKTIATVQNYEITQTSAAVTHLGTLIDNIFATSSLTPSIQSQVIAINDDLIQALARIVENDPEFNPPKDNSELDLFLMNDANVIRYISCQNHGGFMQVLDPTGQIKNKSPYTQTASSFSQSINKQRFAGGMLVDGFAGNVICYPVDFSNPLSLQVNGLIRKPQVPTFFMNSGVRYEVDFFANFAESGVLVTGETTYSATLKLNPIAPGGIPNTVSVTDNDSPGRFKINQSNIPIIIEQPTGIGGISARGYATSNSQGKINSIIIDFPGTGYITSPYINVGGAILNNLSIANGGITNVNIVTGGYGYAVGCPVTIEPYGSFSVVSASGTITQVNAEGSIVEITIDVPGANWTSNVAYRVKFGNLLISVPTPQSGFLDSVPSQIELVTAGNRSMLANDFTQVNDLGYGIFVTNGGFMENVSMFTYYCHRSYYSLNGSQVRTLTGSSVYGNYGLVADGSDPTEVPLSAINVFPLVQIAKSYVVNPLFPAQAGQSYIYVTIDPQNGGYPPYNGSIIEINHKGIYRTYSIGSASQALDSQNNVITNVFQLFFNSGNISNISDTGLLTELTNETPIIIRASTLVKVTGFNPASISRPSTSLTWNDDPTYVYHITGFSTVQPDNSVFCYTQEDYNYILFRTLDQGVIHPSIIGGGVHYTSSTTSVVIRTSNLINGTVQSVNGIQGLNTIGVQSLSMTSVSGIKIGHLVSSTSTYILSDTYVTYVNNDSNIICLSQPSNGPIPNAAQLTFNAIQPSAHAVISSGTIVDIVVDNGGAGWNSPSTIIEIASTGTGTSAAVVSPISIAGVAGSAIIKTSGLDLESQNRIKAGLISLPPFYYQFAFGDTIYNIINYKSPTELNANWAEITLDKPLVESISKGTILRAGIPSANKGSVTTKISILRATSHDFVDIGTGGYASNRIPNDLYGPPIQQRNQTQEVIEINKGRVYYVTSDQDGNVRIGKALTVNQAQGSVTISVPLDLSNLGSISLRRDLGPPINEFSIDSSMVSEADFKVPTEQAVVNYLNRRLGLDRNGNIYPGSPLGPQFLPLSGALPMKGSINLSYHRITNLLMTVDENDAANKNWVDTKISNAGTAATDLDGISLKYVWGNMTGSLQLYRDPETKSATVATTATSGSTNIVFESLTSLTYQPGDFFRHKVTGVGIPAGTFVNFISNDLITLGFGDENGNNVFTTSTIPKGTVLTFEPVYQAATKNYVDTVTAFLSSDKKFKENISDIPNALSNVMFIGGKLFDWTDEYINAKGGEDGYLIQKSDFGVIAQDVQEVFPRATRTKKDGSLVVDYEKLCSLAFAAIKELKQEVDDLKAIIEKNNSTGKM